MPRVLSVTETFVPLTALEAGSLVQRTLLDKSVLNWSMKLLNGAGQEMLTRLLLARFVMERKGRGQTVVLAKAVSFVGFESTVSVAMKPVFVRLPIAVGAIVSVTVAEEPLLMVPKVP